MRKRLTSFGRICATVDDDVSRILRLTTQVIFEDALSAIRIARLRIQGRARVMGHHAITASERVLRRAPDMVLRRRLHVPHVARVARQLPARERVRHRVLVADRAAGGVHEPRAPLEVCEELGVDEVPCALVQRAVYGHDVALGDELGKVGDPARANGILRLCEGFFFFLVEYGYYRQ